ncbi:hypothetical protein DSO57_1003999 [Entomophthora muscae]|uniref:Uncharacterized protein n=1 Tax=Entomophthora muscae TaxID=34485 RepID=A0ACC2SL49_9FUNG|nr:hypothetical protein DSO57_1003999 [Entomophthora muscae]
MTLWAPQPSAKSESEFTSTIHAPNSNYQESSNRSANTNIDLNYKLSFKQSLPSLALDRTIFLRCTKKSSQKSAKPLNSLEDLAHTIDESFVLAYPSQVVNTDVLNSVLTWEESLINLDYFLAWACLHLKLIKSKQPGRATAKPSNSNPTGLNADLNHPSNASQSELKP